MLRLSPEDQRRLEAEADATEAVREAERARQENFLAILHSPEGKVVLADLTTIIDNIVRNSYKFSEQLTQNFSSVCLQLAQLTDMPFAVDYILSELGRIVYDASLVVAEKIMPGYGDSVADGVSRDTCRAAERALLLLFAQTCQEHDRLLAGHTSDTSRAVQDVMSEYLP